jgi:hypothetical protein
VVRAFPLVWVLKHPKSEKNEITPKAYPEEMEVIRASYANTSSAPLFPFTVHLACSCPHSEVEEKEKPELSAMSSEV